MISPDAIIQAACHFALVVLAIAFLLTVYRVVRGPTLPDRVVALDMLVGIVIGFIAVIAVKTGYTLYIDIAIALGLVGFLATIAFARFILVRGLSEDQPDGRRPLLKLEAGLATDRERRKSAGGKTASATGSPSGNPPAKPPGKPAKSGRGKGARR